MSLWDEGSDSVSNIILAEGVYPILLFNVEMMDSKKGEPQLNLQYKLKNNSRVFQKFTMGDKYDKWNTWQLGVLGAISILKSEYAKTDDLKVIQKNLFDIISKLVGHTYLKAEITHNEYNGKTSLRVKLEDLTSKEEFDKSILKYVPKTHTPNLGIDTSEEIPF